jgi:EAL domain-containing protein (putative c-di-GMP-specific phosphodiesterase class I)/GGDEF domain-containing protein/ferredoxin
LNEIVFAEEKMNDVRKGYISVNDNCIGCGRCMLECPASETSISVYRDGQRRLSVDPANCVICGNCVNLCTHKARGYSDDTDSFLEALRNGEKVSVIVSPSFYTTYGKRAENILGYLRSLGVNKVYDSGFGADIFVFLNARFIKEYSGDPRERPFILNSCPTVMNYISRYVPESIKYIIPIQSPPLCTAIYVRKYLGDDSKLVYLSSCASRRMEFDRPSSAGLIDHSVTFRRLMERIGGEDMSGFSYFADLSSSFFGNIVSAGTGLREYISSLFSEKEIIVNYNKLDIKTTALIKSVRDENVPHPFITATSACEFGCVSGCGSDISVQNNYDTYLGELRKIRRESMEKRSRYPSYWDLYQAIANKFIDIEPEDFTAEFEDRYVQLHTVPDHIINDIFVRIRKTTEDKRNIDCRACGYSTCREMAAAVAKGHARIEDCTRYVTEEYRRRLFFDDLTGILSVQGFQTEMPVFLRANPDKKYLIAAGNINGIKTINDLYNFNTGSQVIVYVARALSSIVNGIGICARLGGNNFVMCIENKPENLRRLMAVRYFDCGDMGINMPVTVRFGLCELNGLMDMSRVLNYASFAMQKNTDRTRNTFKWYDENMSGEIKIESAITSQMRQAMYNNEFTMYLQPQYDRSTGAVVGAESLCRWIKRDGTVISPAVFIPIFEKNGFVKKLDRFMWELAFRQVRKWIDDGIDPVPVSVNISRINLVDDEIIDVIGKLKDTYRFDERLIHFEVTESAYTNDQDAVIGRITKIREMGFRIAMDDFGSGYSSLNTLKDIPIDILKLDMGFLRGDSNTEKGENIIGSVIGMAHSLGLLTVAEGVETSEQADFLKSLGCDIIQGFLYARPMPVDEFEELMKNSSFADPYLAIPDARNDFVKLFRRNSSGMRVFESYIGPAAVFGYKPGRLRPVRTNDMMIDMLGFRELSGVEFAQSFDSGLVEEDRDAVNASIDAAINGEDGRVYMFRYIRPDGKQIVVRGRVWYLGKNGDLPLIYTLADDVTDISIGKNNE